MHDTYLPLSLSQCWATNAALSVLAMSIVSKVRSSTDCDFQVTATSLMTICDSASSSYEEFEGISFATASSGINYICLTCDGGLISNGELEIVQISKTF